MHNIFIYYTDYNSHLFY